MNELFNYNDIHTHHAFGKNVIHNVYPLEMEQLLKEYPEQSFSVGIHPWYIHRETLEKELWLLQQYAFYPQIKIIGESGLDKHCATSIDLQLSVFKQHILLSEQCGKPLLIHCVGEWNEIINLHDAFLPKQEWIVHGFRGNPILAHQLHSKGINLSIGKKFNSSTVEYLQRNNISYYLETDDMHS